MSLRANLFATSTNKMHRIFIYSPIGLRLGLESQPEINRIYLSKFIIGYNECRIIILLLYMCVLIVGEGGGDLMACNI